MESLVPIGRFSKMTRLSIKALRLYDELGLLRPAFVDPSSNYRYYRPAQANRAEAIRILRRVDMPLDDIGELLATPDTDLARELLRRHQERLAAEVAERERRLHYLERLIKRKDLLMPYDVIVRDTAPQTVVSTTVHTSLAGIGDSISKAFGTLMGFLGLRGAAPSGAPFIIYHDVIDEETPGNLEVCIPVADALEGSGNVEGYEIQGATVATVTHKGPYDQIGPAYHTLSGWIQDHGHETAGPPRELYLNDPQSVAPDDLLTEVIWPIA